MAIHPPRSDAYDLRPFLGKHLLKICVSSWRFQALGGRCSSFLIRVGNSDYIDILDTTPNLVETVAVITLTSPADDRNSIPTHHDRSSCVRERVCPSFSCSGAIVRIGLVR